MSRYLGDYQPDGLFLLGFVQFDTQFFDQRWQEMLVRLPSANRSAIDGLTDLGHARRSDRTLRFIESKTRIVPFETAIGDLGLTRFGGHPEAFARGAADAKNTPTVFAGISPTDGRSGPCWP